ncbi:MAG: hypothetical protein ABJG42_18720 [Vibrio splendidus]
MVRKIVSLSILAMSFNASALTCTGVIDEVEVSSRYKYVRVFTKAYKNGKVGIEICGDRGAKSFSKIASDMDGGYENNCKAYLSMAEISLATGLPLKIVMRTPLTGCLDYGAYVNQTWVHSMSLIRKDSSNDE